MPKTIQPSASLQSWSQRYKLFLAISGIFLLSVAHPSFRGWWTATKTTFTTNACPQVPPLYPVSSHLALLNELEHEISSDAFKLGAYESLGGAVRIPTVSYDDLSPPGEDKRWGIFGELHGYLEHRFPMVHSKLRRVKVNTYALVFHWPGKDASLRPILLTAHQDVVPVENSTWNEWVHPPFSGYYDGTWIWGRGSCDDKSGVIGILISIETLLRKGFQPIRSVVLAFGIDEERGGISGAGAISEYLLTTYGEDAFAILLDEGGVLEEHGGTVFAMPYTSEKGKLDVRIEVNAPGGHSSIPPAHTSIGLLALLITELEANPPRHQLYRSSAYYEQLQCLASHDPSIPKSLRKLIIGSRHNDRMRGRLEAELAKIDPLFIVSTGTTQAVDIIRGGVKTNALPEQAYAVVDHRIADFSSVASLKKWLTDTIKPIAAEYNLSLDAFSNGTYSPAYGHVRLTDAWENALEPSPITPTVDSGPYKFLSGTILATLEETLDTKAAIVSPALSLGNTDTHHYWALTKHIFRYSHIPVKDIYNGAHTINEAVRGEGFLQIIRFFVRFILNADDTDLL